MFPLVKNIADFEYLWTTEEIPQPHILRVVNTSCNKLRMTWKWNDLCRIMIQLILGLSKETKDLNLVFCGPSLQQLQTIMWILSGDKWRWPTTYNFQFCDNTNVTQIQWKQHFRCLSFPVLWYSFKVIDVVMSCISTQSWSHEHKQQMFCSALCSQISYVVVRGTCFDKYVRESNSKGEKRWSHQ